MIGYHATTPAKLARYKASGCILMPVRFWANEQTAREWAKRTQRSIVLRIEADVAYPLHDHKPLFRAWWTPDNVREWTELPHPRAATKASNAQS